MSYTIYISNNCASCDRVLSYVNERQIKYNLINVHDPGNNPVEGVLIYPALFNDENLLAYGDDIISWLERVSKVA